ncbi:DUF4102 domain-containing protein [Roseomonas nepalensis]|uniref:DUF4102 domain-containing protein n=1 Tax=Muricoccus nepalensis TaxID=1854500 RepID=A0A502FJF0_9PROT|nr:integrase arm-type DNA-binding domain-containing protein [Roseomonas nepalensis]TPG49551.1 DUF4102 domain-containing protein [Roseomonas nepalensis]
MSRQNSLSDRAVAAAKPRATTYRLTDRDGLLLEVRPSGAKAWTFRFMLRGQRRDMGLGAYPAVSLKAARDAVAAARALLATGTDPVEHRRATVTSRQTAEREAKAAAEASAASTFRALAEVHIATQSPGWTSQATLASWRWTMDTYAYPALGDLPVATITREDVTRTLLPLRASHPATSIKVQRRIAMILDLAILTGRRILPNPATGRALRLAKALPTPAAAKQQPSLPWRRVPAFLAALDACDGVAPLALRLLVLTALRSAEVRGAQWSELDVAGRVWTIPAARMKGGKAGTGREQRVPLSAAMLDALARAAALRTGQPVPPTCLDAVARLAGDALIFPSANPRQPLSDAALSAVLLRMNRRTDGKPGTWHDTDGRPAVPHGFRRSFRTWVDDTRPADGELAEKALAHAEANKAWAAYRASDMLEGRRALMEAWGVYAAGAVPTAASSADGAAAC